MQIPERLYKSIPGIYMVMGLALVYFTSEAILYKSGPVVQGLLLVSSFMLIFSALRVMRLRKQNRKPD